MKRLLHRSLLAVGLTVAISTGSYGTVIERPPTLQDLEGCWIALGSAGAAFRLCVTTLGDATLAHTHHANRPVLKYSLSEFALSGKRLRAKILGDGYLSSRPLKGEATSFSITLTVPRSEFYKKRTVVFFREDPSMQGFHLLKEGGTHPPERERR